MAGEMRSLLICLRSLPCKLLVQHKQGLAQALKSWGKPKQACSYLIPIPDPRSYRVKLQCPVHTSGSTNSRILFWGYQYKKNTDLKVSAFYKIPHFQLLALVIANQVSIFATKL